MNDPPALLAEKVALAQGDKRRLDQLIGEYAPFIKKCVSGVFFQGQLRRDYLTEAMLGFIQAVKTYREEKGAFIVYAQIVIRNRLINAAKKEAAMQPKSLDGDKYAQWEYEGSERQYTELTARKEAQVEIAELNGAFARWGFDWAGLLKSCPRQARSRGSCYEIARAVWEDKPLLAQALKTGKLPIKKLCSLAGYSEKKMEKFRRYISALILIMEGDYPYIHSFLPQLFEKERTL